MISANRVLSNKRARLSKSEFATIQKQIEQYKNRKYPQLNSNHYQKLTIKELLSECFNRATSKKSLENILDSE
jgi:hypothetical protein